MLSRTAVRQGRVRLGVGAAVVLVIVGIGVAVVAGTIGGGGAVQTVPEPTAVSVTSAPRTDAAASVLVHVLGAVRHPGVYELPEGSRVLDAVGAAGGFAKSADQGGVNLARKVVDGEQLAVPKKGEAAVAGGASGNTGATGVSGTPQSGAKLNLNTATEAELEQLPRIGPAMAQRIIDWRTANGGFTSVDDLRNVTGIGDKTFAQLADLVTV